MARGAKKPGGVRWRLWFGLAALASLHFDATDALNGVAVAGLRVGRSEAANIKADSFRADPGAFATVSGFVSDDNFFGGEFDAAI